MLRSVLIFTCALAAAACGGTDTKTAQDPSTTSTTSAPSNPSSATTSPSDTTASPSSANGANGTGDTSALPANGTAPATMGTSNGTGSSSGMQAMPPGNGSSALAPAIQGTSKSETDTTAAIHKAVLGSKGLSKGAKKVTIITMGTKVTLQGSVSSDSEKSTIEGLAQNAAGVTNVDNQLQVITK